MASATASRTGCTCVFVPCAWRRFVFIVRWWDRVSLRAVTVTTGADAAGVAMQHDVSELPQRLDAALPLGRDKGNNATTHLPGPCADETPPSWFDAHSTPLLCNGPGHAAIVTACITAVTAVTACITAVTADTACITAVTAGTSAPT